MSCRKVSKKRREGGENVPLRFLDGLYLFMIHITLQLAIDCVITLMSLGFICSKEEHELNFYIYHCSS
jgi:hypothetical protein